MLEEFNKYLASLCYNYTEKQYLLTVSGGIDSVVMTHLFNSSNLNFIIAHCNFNLRGIESELDQQFVEQMARNFNVKCFTRTFNTRGIADETGISIQMAARDIRYKWFQEIATDQQCDFIVIGHNSNDVIETMLLNLSRGTGIKGLTGIKARRNNLLRPLLFASRKIIENYAMDNGLKWREDSSNTSVKYHRNKIRHNIIPVFESINPSFISSTLETIKRIEETNEFLEAIIDNIKKDIIKKLPDRILVDLEKLKEYKGKNIVLFELLRDFGVNQLDVDKLSKSVFGSISGKQFITRTHVFTRDRKDLIITTKIKSDNNTEILINSNTEFIDYPFKLSFKKVEQTNMNSISKERNLAALDAEKIEFPLLLRKWKKGDKFQPLGLKGTKKVSDFLIDKKVALPDKSNIWLIESNNNIIWLVNQRIDNRYKITDKTRKILLIEYIE